jgi:hypothetical protein
LLIENRINKRWLPFRFFQWPFSKKQLPTPPIPCSYSAGSTRQSEPALTNLSFVSDDSTGSNEIASSSQQTNAASNLSEPRKLKQDKTTRAQNESQQRIESNSIQDENFVMDPDLPNYEEACRTTEKKNQSK